MFLAKTPMATIFEQTKPANWQSSFNCALQKIKEKNIYLILHRIIAVLQFSVVRTTDDFEIIFFIVLHKN